MFLNILQYSQENICVVVTFSIKLWASDFIKKVLSPEYCEFFQAYFIEDLCGCFCWHHIYYYCNFVSIYRILIWIAHLDVFFVMLGFELFLVLNSGSLIFATVLFSLFEFWDFWLFVGGTTMAAGNNPKASFQYFFPIFIIKKLEQ